MSLDLIKEHRPDLYSVITYDWSFYDYLKWLNSSQVDHEYFWTRRTEVIAIIKASLVDVLTIEQLQDFDVSILSNPLNTTDHFWFIQHPEPFNTALVDILRQGNPSTYLSLPWWKVSLNNFTEPFRLNIGWNRWDIYGYYTNRTKNHLIWQLPFLSCTEEGIKKFLKSIGSADSYADVLLKIFWWTFSSFQEQCISANNIAFKQLLNSQNAYLFIDKYDIVKKYLAYLLKSKSNIVYEIFQSKILLEMLLGWNNTDIFWLIEDRKQKHLLYVDWFLYDEKWSKIIDLSDTEKIILLLEEWKLIIGLPLMYIILSFYVWIECLGWRRQTLYLWNIKNRWENILKRMNRTEEIWEMSQINFSKLIWWFILKKDRYLMDYLLSGETLSISEIENLSKSVSPSFFMDLPRIIYSIQKNLW